MPMLHIKIKDNAKAAIVLNLLKELPFVEIEDVAGEIAETCPKKGKGSLADLFGIWEKRDISLSDIREKAWRKHES